MVDRNATASTRPGLTTFYNDACPVCGTEMRAYARYAEAEGLPLHWVGIDSEPDALADRGLSEDDVKRRLYAVDEEGRLHRGIDAFLVLWARMPRYRWLARLLGLPVLRQIFWLAYEGVVAPIVYRWDRIRCRRAAARRRREGYSSES